MGGKYCKILKIKAIALISGGLDSILAAKLILEQGIEVEGVAFKTPFFGARKARTAAQNIGLPLFIIDITEEHLEMLKAPRYGYGKNMNPCIDCHILMLKIAGKRMEAIGADFIVTGEVLGQRPMSQGRQSLGVVAKKSGYQEYILRPLSAKLLAETKPEREGKVAQQKLLDLQGRSRKRQLEMARQYGITNYSTPAGGCLLTDPMFSKRLKDLFAHHRDFRVRDIELLKFGRHFRINNTTTVIVGRNSSDNKAIQRLYEEGDILIYMTHFPGPTVIVPYGGDEETCYKAAAICAYYSDAPKDVENIATCTIGKNVTLITTKAFHREDMERWII
ncbi:MAG: tRNA 4-thiouridine(8) synthase ThiI [Syntrophaceae bacterium CG2_30_49_12]|nr:MAG: tRNA 4-thiouridine(8) synthase ThiI [Syntrophaceae bacterium CG2_30_49_12]PIP08483.1 MAG: tRNA 4-thiouridine(8) synthase ThiI [Syntrophobacterales bacterium CG23_combo_of_CG06-09_8_20_14_all_48_27]PJA49810.1 MAG: tRNA 4-thiouridine(8) synthase ThiI [Syntrophobacterales bacterium CG_4_9_14_3_um_filter_49_8]